MSLPESQHFKKERKPGLNPRLPDSKCTFHYSSLPHSGISQPSSRYQPGSYLCIHLSLTLQVVLLTSYSAWMMLLGVVQASGFYRCHSTDREPRHTEGLRITVLRSASQASGWFASFQRTRCPSSVRAIALYAVSVWATLNSWAMPGWAHLTESVPWGTRTGSESHCGFQADANPKRVVTVCLHDYI